MKTEGAGNLSFTRGWRWGPATSMRGPGTQPLGTWQGRLPQELRIRHIRNADEANHFLRSHYIAEFNRKFVVPAAQSGSAFVPITHLNLDRIFAIHHERV